MSDSTLLPALRRWEKNISPGGLWSYGGLSGRWHLSPDIARSISNDLLGFRLEELAELVHDAREAPRLRAVADAAKALLAALDALSGDVGVMTEGVTRNAMDAARDALAAALAREEE